MTSKDEQISINSRVIVFARSLRRLGLMSWYEYEVLDAYLTFGVRMPQAPSISLY